MDRRDVNYWLSPKFDHVPPTDEELDYGHPISKSQLARSIGLEIKQILIREGSIPAAAEARINQLARMVKDEPEEADGVPARARNERMDLIVKAIHGSPEFSFEGACEAVDKAQRAIEVAASFVQLHAPDSPLYGDLRRIAASMTRKEDAVVLSTQAHPDGPVTLGMLRREAGLHSGDDQTHE